MRDRTADACWICGKFALSHWNIRDESQMFDCRVCGKYCQWPSARADDAESQALLPYLAAHIRQLRSAERFAVTEGWVDVARGHANSTISQRLRLLLERIESRSKFGETIGEELELLAPLIDAHDSREALFLLRHLEQLKFVQLETLTQVSHERAPGASGEFVRIHMLVGGWEAISPTAGAGVAGTCFVAMSFDKALDPAYDDGMIPAIVDDCKFNVVRVDRVEHNDDITDRILAGIRSAQFVVADFTGQRQGVYFEAGFAAGLGRTVIWTCHEDDVENLHFDTRQRNHILWRTPAELREKLTQRIRATVALPARLG
jgi:hypothetical protein